MDDFKHIQPFEHQEDRCYQQFTNVYKSQVEKLDGYKFQEWFNKNNQGAGLEFLPLISFIYLKADIYLKTMGAITPNSYSYMGELTVKNVVALTNLAIEAELNGYQNFAIRFQEEAHMFMVLGFIN